MTQTTAHPTAHHPTAEAHAPRFARELGFLLAGFPIGVGAFVAGITMFSFGVGLLVTLLGVPVLVGALTAARGLARVERRRVEAVTGRSLPPHHYREPGGTGLAGLLNRLREPQAWRDLLHTVVAFPVRMLGFALALAWTVGGVGEVLYVLWSWAIPRDDDEQGLLDLAFDISSRSADIGFHTGIGVVLLATAVPVVRALVAMQTALARGLLTNQHAAVRAHRGR